MSANLSVTVIYARQSEEREWRDLAKTTSARMFNALLYQIVCIKHAKFIWFVFYSCAYSHWFRFINLLAKGSERTVPYEYVMQKRYNAFLQAHLNYSSTEWGSALRKRVQTLCTNQRWYICTFRAHKPCKYEQKELIISSPMQTIISEIGISHLE